MNPSFRNTINALTPPLLLSAYHRLKLGNRDRPGSSENGAPSHRWRSAVGGSWDTIGRLQFDFLLGQGLQPDHRFLDIGCGSMRGGVHFVKYLNRGHYFGIDYAQWLLDAAVEHELPQAGLQADEVTLICRGDFDFTAFNTKFDYALAQSVFTHLEWNSIQRCLFNVAKVLDPSGFFFATFFEDQDATHAALPIRQCERYTTYPDRDPFHYAFEDLNLLAKKVGLKASYLGDWGHPFNQKIAVFQLAKVP